MKKKAVVLYHQSCADGFSSAWVARQALSEMAVEAEYIACRYGEDPPELDSDVDVVYILDFSFEKDVILEMKKKVGAIRIIDHHKTARDNLISLIPFKVPTDRPIQESIDGVSITFDMDKCGAVLTWEHFYRGQEVPLFLQYIQDHDLWRFELPMSREFSARLNMVPFGFDDWSYIADVTMEDRDRRQEFLEEGRLLELARDESVKRASKHAFRLQMGDLWVPCVSSPDNQSQIGNLLAKEAPAAAVFFIDRNGYFTFSLRSSGDFKDHVDVSEIATKYGGGGHKHAAGFRRKPDQVLFFEEQGEDGETKFHMSLVP